MSTLYFAYLNAQGAPEYGECAPPGRAIIGLAATRDGIEQIIRDWRTQQAGGQKAPV